MRDIGLRTVLLETLVKQALFAPGLLITAQSAPIDLDKLKASANILFQLNNPISRLGVLPAGKSSIYFSRNETSRSHGSAAAGVVENAASKGKAPQGKFESLGSSVVSIEHESIIAMQPVQLRRGSSEFGFWGYATATIKLADLAKALRLDEMEAQGYSLSLDYFHGDTVEGEALLSVGGRPRENSISHEIVLPQGDRIHLRASPPDKWNVLPMVLPEFYLLLACGALVSFLTYLLLYRREAQEEQAVFQMLQLEMDKELLESELERRDQAEMQLKNSHDLLNSIFEHIPSMIVLKSASDLKVERVNRFGETVFGQTNETLAGRLNKEIYSAEQAEHHTETDLMAISQRRLVELPEQFVQIHGGTALWLKIKKLALFDDKGNPTHVLELGEDVTTHKHLDEALTDNLNLVEQLLAAIPTPVFFKDINGFYMGVNKAFEDFYGTTGEDMVGKTVFDIAPPDLAEIYDEADRDLLKSGGTQTYEARVKSVDGVDKDVLFYKAVFSTAHAKIGGIVGIVLDVTEQKAAERHVLRLNHTLAVISEANQAILRAKDCQTLIKRTVDILHETGGFPLAWVYSISDALPALVVTGERADLAAEITAKLQSGIHNSEDGNEEIKAEQSEFFASLSDCDVSPAEIHLEFELHGLAHLRLWVAGKLAGGVCIVGLSEHLLDEKEQGLLISLAENLSHAVDSLEQERARQIAERKLELAAHVFENSAEGVMITDKNNNIVMVNRRFSEISGYSPEEVIGNSPNLLNSGQQDKAFYSNMWRSLTNRGEWHGEIRNRRKDGQVIVEWMNISAVKDDSGAIINFVAVFSEITVHKTIKKRMQFLAHYDALTSLPNRILFGDRLEQSIIAARRNKRHTVLMLIDLDRFDQINKAVGHSAGDTILQEVSARLLASVEEGSSVSRLGGDEFAIVLPDIDASDQAESVANRIQQELSRAVYVANSDLHVTASIGISVFPRDGEDSESLTKSADAAMYLAAEAGGNCYRFPQTNEKLSDRIRLRDRLRRAVERDELKVLYQPLVSGVTGRIVGAEALLRWFRPEDGYISADIFVPVLEESGLVTRVGDWVLRTALANNLAWRKDFDSELFIAVNFSAGQLADERVVEKVDAALKSLVFEPRHLYLEMSERTLMQDAPASLTFLHRLKDLGVRLSIDNFGTGYSSLSYLNRFPIDMLKIDRSLIQDTPNDAEAVAVTRTVIAMGHALGLKIAAEGVETISQAAHLRQANCDVLQGYRFSQAVSAEEFAVLLAENNQTSSLFPEAETANRLHLVG